MHARAPRCNRVLAYSFIILGALRSLFGASLGGVLGSLFLAMLVCRARASTEPCPNSVPGGHGRRQKMKEPSQYCTGAWQWEAVRDCKLMSSNRSGWTSIDRQRLPGLQRRQDHRCPEIARQLVVQHRYPGRHDQGGHRAHDLSD